MKSIKITFYYDFFFQTVRSVTALFSLATGWVPASSWPYEIPVVAYLDLNQDSVYPGWFIFFFSFKKFFFIIIIIFYFTILYWFCHPSTCIRHGCTRVPHPEPHSHLPPHTIPLGHPSAPAPSFLHRCIFSFFVPPLLRNS